jgi:RNA polymerase sigma-70 factor (ECF subfamily)
MGLSQRDMSGANSLLRNFLVERYDHLITQLKQRLNSTELAHEALHDTYLRLERAKEIRAIDRPTGYLLRIALNLAYDRQRASARLLSVPEIETALNLVDEAPDPAREAEAKSSLQAVERALAKMPARRRAILVASFKENLPSKAIAQRFGLSVRKIDMELKEARDMCARELALRPNK